MRLLGALAFAVACLLALAGHPGTLRAADPVAPAPDVAAQDGPFTRNQQVDLAFIVPPEGGPVSEYRASNDAATSDGILTNGAAVTANAALDAGSRTRRATYRLRTGQVRVGTVVSGRQRLADPRHDPIELDLRRFRQRRLEDPAPPDFDWHARTATPADRVFGLGVYDGTGPAEVGVGDEQRFIYFVTATGPVGVGSFDVQRAGDSGCESACATVGARGRFCEASGGSFTITDIAFTPEGDLAVLDADFRLECIDTLMSGSIRYGASRDIVALDQDAESLQFPDETIGGVSATRSISFTNIGTTSTSLGDAALAGGQPGDFAISSDDCSGTTLAVGRVLRRRRRVLPIGPGSAPGVPRHPRRDVARLQARPGAGAGRRADAAQGRKGRGHGGRQVHRYAVRDGPRHGCDGLGGHRPARAQQPPKQQLCGPTDRPSPALDADDGRRTQDGLRALVEHGGARLGRGQGRDPAGHDGAHVHAAEPIHPGWGSGDRRTGPRRPDLDGVGRDVRGLAVCPGGQPERSPMGADRRPDDHTARRSPPSHGTDYRFRVRAIDNAGNVGAWAPSVRFHIVGTKAHPRIEVVQVR